MKRKLTFITHAHSGSMNGHEKAAVNAHIARNSHELKRQRQKQSLYLTPSCSISTDSSENSPVDEQASPYLYHTVSRGNSDPFDCLPIKIDAKANFYLSFGRDVIEQIIWNIGPRGWSAHNDDVYSTKTPLARLTIGADLYRRRSSNDSMSVLNREIFSALRAFATLAYCAGGLYALSGLSQYSNSVMGYSAKCVAGLRALISRSSDVSHLQVEEIVYRLFRADVMCRNYDTATVHGTFLRQLLEQQAHKGNLDLGSLSTALYSDNALALGAWQRPLIHPEWIKEVYAIQWDMADFTCDALFGRYTETTCGTDDLKLRTILNAQQKLFSQSFELPKTQQVASKHDWYWFVSRCEHLQNCLINYYFDSKEAEQHEDPTMWLNNMTTTYNQCLALAAVLALRHQKNCPQVNGTPLYEGDANLFKKLTSTLRALEVHITVFGPLYGKENAMLWITFIAAITQRKLHAVLIKGDYHEDWGERLLHAMKSLSLCTWADAERRFSELPYAASEMPVPLNIALGLRQMLSRDHVATEGSSHCMTYHKHQTI